MTVVHEAGVGKRLRGLQGCGCMVLQVWGDMGGGGEQTSHCRFVVHRVG